ncbi:TlpA family protein disulfide reductase [Sphingobacterium cavernae]|uniref:TlpA family protein disulfide reductase n=1 Tax=Sphingobacterium cavernae TaxID=2592657 RepID=UPI00166DD0ED|nr:redoxin domain-containing protein [Sphingobacterium cavernae]
MRHFYENGSTILHSKNRYHKDLDIILRILFPRLWIRELSIAYPRPVLLVGKRTILLMFTRAVALFVSLMFSYLAVTPAYGQEPVGLGEVRQSKRDLLLLNQAVESRYRPELNDRVVATHADIDLARYPIIAYKVDTTKIGYIHVGESIPDIILDMPLKLINDSEGRTVTTLRELSDKKFLVLDFWAKWCKPCLESMMKWEEIHPEIAADIRVVGVHLDYDFRAIVEVGDRDWKLPQIIGAEGHLLNYYFLSRSYLGPSIWIKNGRLFGVSKASIQDTNYIFDLIHDRIDQLPTEIQVRLSNSK